MAEVSSIALALIAERLQERGMGGQPKFSTVRFLLPAGATIRAEFLVPYDQVWMFLREIRDMIPGVVYETCVRDGLTTFERALLQPSNMTMEYLTPYLVYTNLYCDFENSSSTQAYMVEITFAYMVFDRYWFRQAARELGFAEAI